MRTLVHRRDALGNKHRYSLLYVDVTCIDPDFIRFLKCDTTMLAQFSSKTLACDLSHLLLKSLDAIFNSVRLISILCIFLHLPDLSIAS
jgi:hypothetical protein